MIAVALACVVVGQTTVSARGDDSSAVPLDSGALIGAPEDALLAAPGLSLVHGGGPLAPTRVLIRGLSGARVPALLDGLALADPADALLDAAALPLALVDDVAVETGAGSGVAGAIKMRAPRSGLFARATAGSLSFARFSGRASHEAGLMAGIDLATTRGDFSFLPASPLGVVDEAAALRTNNDQQRATILAGAHVGDELTADIVAIASAHDGGVPGFISTPLPDLRMRRGLVGARLDVRAPAPLGRLHLGGHGRAAHQETSSALFGRDVLESNAIGLVAAVENLALDEALRVDVRSTADHSAIVGGVFARLEASAAAAARLVTSGVRWRASVDGRFTSDRGPMLSASAGASVGGDLRAGISFVRTNRAPTLDELHAPRGLVLGNPRLRPEAANDVELSLGYDASGFLEVRAAAWAGLLEEAIVYLNQNAYEIAPVNTGAAWRAGADVSTIVQPSSWLELRVAAAALASRLDVTRAPLPSAPPFASLLALRIGAADGLRVEAQMRSRAASPSTLFGTLPAPGYSLVDAGLSIPLHDCPEPGASPGAGDGASRTGVGASCAQLELRGAVQNVFDVRDARDQNLLPLPGRLLFLALEVRR